MPGSHRNQAPQLIAGGDIYPSRFVMVSTAADNTALGCTAGSAPIGISQVGTKTPITNPLGQLGGSSSVFPDKAAESGDTINIFGLGDICLLECGGTVTRGDLLEASGTTTNVGQGVTSGPGRPFGAVALESGTLGQLIRVQIVLASGGGAGAGSANQTLSASTATIGVGDSGKTFFLSRAAGITVTLPTATLGLKYKFIVAVAPTSVGYIITATPTDTLFGNAVERAGGSGVAGTAADVVTFVANQSIIGDTITVESDGTNWLWTGQVDINPGITTSG